MKKSFCHHQDNEEEEISYCLVLWNPQFTLWRWNLLQIEELSWKPLNSLLTSQCIITERVGSQICEQRATKCKKNSAVSIVCKFTSKDKINVFLEFWLFLQNLLCIFENNNKIFDTQLTTEALCAPSSWELPLRRFLSPQSAEHFWPKELPSLRGTHPKNFGDWPKFFWWIDRI